MSKQAVLDAFLSGDLGQVEFFELALEAGLSMEEIGQALEEREDDF